MYCTLPLHKDSGLHCMDDAAKPRLLLWPPSHHTHLPGEGRRQPITHLHGHGVRLDIAELILCIQQASERREKKERKNISILTMLMSLMKMNES